MARAAPVIDLDATYRVRRPLMARRLHKPGARFDPRRMNVKLHRLRLLVQQGKLVYDPTVPHKKRKPSKPRKSPRSRRPPGVANARRSRP